MTTTKIRSVMTATARLALVVALGGAGLVAAAGCGSGPSCDKAVANVAKLRDLSEVEAKISVARCKREGWSEALRSCAAGAKTADDAERCAAKRSREPSNDFDSYMTKSKATEAELQLRYVEKALKTHYAETATFPQGEVGPTPEPGSCCNGPGHKCAPDSSLWTGVDVWDTLDFELVEPHSYSYSYRSAQSDRAVVEAIGDLDCDSITSTYTLICRVDNYSPVCTLERPDHVD